MLKSLPFVVLVAPYLYVYFPQRFASECLASGQVASLRYFHDGGSSDGAVDEFDKGLRIVADEGGVVEVKWSTV